MACRAAHALVNGGTVSLSRDDVMRLRADVQMALLTIRNAISRFATLPLPMGAAGGIVSATLAMAEMALLEANRLMNVTLECAAPAVTVPKPAPPAPPPAGSTGSNLPN